ncbi:hypothetical protein ACP70R_048832 [Stipagrostis hirtigluma subsp. patula]
MIAGELLDLVGDAAFEIVQNLFWFLGSLKDNLNAVVALDTVTNVKEACAWLGYTYLFIRMNTKSSGVWDSLGRVIGDPSMGSEQKAFIIDAVSALVKAKMMRYDEKTGRFYCTKLGRIASHFYLHYFSVETYNEMLRRHMSESEVITMVYISHAPIDSSSLHSDAQYVNQSLACIMMALFDICLRRGWCDMTSLLLEYCKAVDHKIWPHIHPLGQFDRHLSPQDSENDTIYHSELFTLTKKMASGTHTKISFNVTILEPHPPQYHIRTISDSLLHADSVDRVSSYSDLATVPGLSHCLASLGQNSCLVATQDLSPLSKLACLAKEARISLSTHESQLSLLRDRGSTAQCHLDDLGATELDTGMTLRNHSRIERRDKREGKQDERRDHGCPNQPHH